MDPPVPFNSTIAMPIVPTLADGAAPAMLDQPAVAGSSDNLAQAGEQPRSTVDLTTLASAGDSLPLVPSLDLWIPFYSHLAALSNAQRAEFLMKLTQADTHYASLVAKAASRQRATIEPLSAGESRPAASVMGDAGLEQAVENLLEILDLSSIVKTATEQARQMYSAVQLKQTELFGGAQLSSSVVNIAGLPFLLQVPAGLSVPHNQRLEAYVDMAKYQATRTTLAAMLAATKASAAYGYTSSSRSRQGVAADDYHQANAAVPNGIVAGLAQRVGGFGAIGIGQQAAARLAGPGMPVARMAVVINVDEIVSLLVPLAFLAVKLGFLIYIFGRHATPKKRYIMIAMAVFWVFWEGRAIRRRRRQQEARLAIGQQQALRQINEQRLARARTQQAQTQAGQPHTAGATDTAQQVQQAADPQNPGLNHTGATQAVAPGSAEEQALIAAGVQNGLERYQRERDRARAQDRRAREAGAVPGAPANVRPTTDSRSRRHSDRPAPSRLSPKYWLTLIARVGMSAEAREMGITRAAVAANLTGYSVTRSEDGDTAANAAAGEQPPAVRYRLEYRPPRLTISRVLRIIFICIVLFFGTLIPEVERIRKKYLERRQRRITDLETARTAAAVIARRNAVESAERIAQAPEGHLSEAEQADRRWRDRHQPVDPTRMPTLSPPPAAVPPPPASPGSRLRYAYIPESDDPEMPSNEDASAAEVTTGAGTAQQAIPTGATSQAMGATSSSESSSDHSQAGGIAERANARAAAAVAAQQRQRALSGAAIQGASRSVSDQLFDPPFDQAAYSAALAHPPNAVGGSAAPAVGHSGSVEQRDRAVSNARDALDPDERMRLGVMDDPSVPTTPLRSPAEPESEDDDALLDADADGEGENEGEGVDDEVGMYVIVFVLGPSSKADVCVSLTGFSFRRAEGSLSIAQVVSCSSSAVVLSGDFEFAMLAPRATSNSCLEYSCRCVLPPSLLRRTSRQQQGMQRCC